MYVTCVVSRSIKSRTWIDTGQQFTSRVAPSSVTFAATHLRSAPTWLGMYSNRMSILGGTCAPYATPASQSVPTLSNTWQVHTGITEADLLARVRAVEVTTLVAVAGVEQRPSNLGVEQRQSNPAVARIQGPPRTGRGLRPPIRGRTN